MESSEDRTQPAVRVYTLGRFRVEVDATPVDVEGRRHHRPWQLLKLLVALGGDSVQETQLVEALWLELDGDRAHRAFITNLYRLRQLIGREALRLEQGRLTLARSECWVDAIAAAEALSDALRDTAMGEPNSAGQRAQGALELYKGPFLAGEFDFPEVLSARERLHSQFLRTMQEVGLGLCDLQQGDFAVRLLRAALEVDDQSEELYQALMHCLLQQGRATDGLAIYERCRRMLEVVAGAHPSPQTEALHQRLTSHRATYATMPGKADLAGPATMPTQADRGLPPVPPEGERRQAAVLVFVVPGYSRLLEAGDPEKAAEAMHCIQGWVTRCVEGHGGVVSQLVRNQVVALFGVPMAHEDDPRRALQSALEACEHLRDACPQPNPEAAGELALAAGVASGLVLVEAGDERSGRYNVTGAPITAATLLAEQAPAGHVLVTRETASLIGPFFELMDYMAQEPEHAEALRVVRELPFATRFEAASQRRLTRFVGRATELALLKARLHDASNGLGQVVVVKGEAGVGKSRLLYEFARRADERGVSLLQGRCQTAGVATPYLPFRGVLRQLFNVPDDATLDAAANHIIAHVQASAPVLEPYLPHYLHLLSLPAQGHTLPERLTGEALRRALQQALEAALLRGLPAPPLVLLLEDWHWADEASAAVLRHLAERVATHPVLIIVTWRPEQAAGKQSLQPGLILELNPLSAQHGEAMIRWSLGAPALPEGLAATIQGRTGGNPFFIEEIATHLLDSGALVLPEGGAELTVSLERLPLPATIEAVIRSRLDRLDPQQCRVVSMAALIGREFPAALLAELVPEPEALERDLDGLVEQGIVQPIGLLPQPRFRFKHVLTQRVAYDALLRPQREQLHEQLGHLLESWHAKQLEQHYEELAYHFAHSADLEKAMHYLKLAGAKAAGFFALKDARQHYRTAVALLEGRLAGERERRLRITFTLCWAEVSFYAASRELLQALESAGADAVTLGDHCEASRVSFAKGQMFYVWARFAEALREFRDCAAASSRLGSADLRMRSRLYIGRCCYFTAEFAAGRRQLHRSIADLQAQGDLAAAGYGGLMLASIHGWTGRFDAADSVFDEVMAAASHIDDPSLKSAALNMRSIVRTLRGDFASALSDGSTAAELAGRIDNVYIASYARIASGYAHVMQGEQEHGLALMEEGVASATEDGGEGMPVLVAWHAEALALAGRLVEAQTRLNYAERSALLTGQRIARPSLLRTRALIAHGANPSPPDHAATLMQESIQEMRKMGARPDAAIGQFRLAEMLGHHGDSAGLGLARRAARAFGTLEMTWWADQAEALRGRIERGEPFKGFAPYAE